MFWGFEASLRSRGGVVGRIRLELLNEDVPVYRL